MPLLVTIRMATRTLSPSNIELGGIVLALDFHSPPTSTRVKLHFLDLLHKRDIPPHIPSIKPTPYNWLDIMESCIPWTRQRMKDWNTNDCSVTLNDSDPEVGQHQQEAMSPLTVGEVIQWEGARGDAVIKLLPFCIFIDTDPTINVGAIGEMDHVAEYPEELLIHGHEPLQSRVRIAELPLP